jgi:hypothetical protein
MNKYSKKIINFLNKDFKDDFTTKININHTLIKQIIEIAKQSINQKIEYNNIITTKINNLHIDQQYPILYQLFITEYPIFHNFLNWYIVNQESINFYKYKTHNVYDLIFNNPDRKELHDLLYNNQFISIDICHYFEINNIIKININNNIYNLNLYITDNDKDKMYEYLDKIIKIINFMYNLNIRLINKKAQKINVNILLSHQRKEIGELDILTPMNINSGSAMRGVVICVWREEELEKVLIHEIQHYFNCDFDYGTENYNYVKDILNKYFKVDGKDMVNESYNETMAHIINMCYQSVKLNMSLDKIYDYEMKFLLFQTSKIINLFGGNNILNTNYKQTTSVLSYYVIKTLLMFNINDTIDLINNFELKCVNENIKKYGDFLKEILEKTKIDDYINNMIKILENMQDYFIKRTLRMTAIN